MDVQPAIPPDALKGARVIVCCEDEFDTKQIDRVLEIGGMYNLGHAADGRAAIHLALMKRPDIAILEGRLPYHNGILTGRMIRQAFPACIVLLASRTDYDLRIAADSSDMHCVVKPIDPVEFLHNLGDAYSQFLTTCAESSGPFIDWSSIVTAT